ncbi:hypothetical protein BJV82DRAFT_250374 [Fennellomyces sp. T-0311]|nr:hypothetical protein BJV82DRAFT_250374 [Fennellomyces sp. T-0311]
MPRGQNNNRRAGMFNNGKSSSKAKKGAPDLVFSESRFLRVQSSACSTDPVIDTIEPEPAIRPVPDGREPHEPVPYIDGSSKFFADHDKTVEYAEPDSSYQEPPCYARGDTPVDLLLLAQPMHNDVVAPYEEVMPSSPLLLSRDSYYNTEQEEPMTEDDDASLGYTTNDDTMPDLRYFWQQRRAY